MSLATHTKKLPVEVNKIIWCFSKPYYMNLIDNLDKKQKKIDKYKHISIQLIQFNIIYNLENKQITTINFPEGFPDEFNLSPISCTYLEQLDEFSILSNIGISLINFYDLRYMFANNLKTGFFDNNYYWFPLNFIGNSNIHKLDCDDDIIDKTDKIDKFVNNHLSKIYKNYTYIPILAKLNRYNTNYIRLYINSNTDFYKINNSEEIDDLWDSNYNEDDKNQILYNDTYKVNTTSENFLRTTFDRTNVLRIRIKFHSIWIDHTSKTFGVRMDIVKINKYLFI